MDEMMEAARLALEPLCADVYEVSCAADPLPDSYIVLTPVDVRPDGYAGDRDVLRSGELRAAWYRRGSVRGLEGKMVKALREAGFGIGESARGRDEQTKHNIVYLEVGGECEG